MKNDKRIGVSLTYEGLCLLFEKFKEENGRYPLASEMKNKNGLPSWTRLLRICGDNYPIFKEKYINETAIKVVDVDFERCKQLILNYCKQLGKIPSQKEINENKELPSLNFINRLFKKNGYKTYQEYCMEHNFTKEKRKIEKTYISFEELCKKYNDFYDVNERYPYTHELTQNGFPSYEITRKICEDKYEDFIKVYNNKNKKFKPIFYEMYCQQILELAKTLERTPTYSEVFNDDFPNLKWFKLHSPSNIAINDFNDLLNYLNINLRMSKENISKIVIRKYEELKRPLLHSDFEHNDEISISSIYRVWGSFTEMLLELELPINDLNKFFERKNIEEMQNDIIKLCKQIESTEGRKIITYYDIRSCDWCQDPSTYSERFQEELGISLCEFINSIGFKNGAKYSHIFEDGELVKSKYEFNVSTFLKQNNINYLRDVKYKTFINGYIGNKDCDYMIENNGEIWYVEVAGMMDKENATDKIRKQYRINLEEKKKMLKESKLNHKIIYPNDLNRKPLNEIFDFLF